MAMAGFDLEAFFPKRVMQLITQLRVEQPEVVMEEARRRKRRQRLTHDGKLAIVATDHPGRGVTRIGDDPLRMGNRWEYLGRALRVLLADGFDGIMGTPDFIEDLLIISHIVRRNGGPSLLDEKVMIGCMQRGGVAGIKGEIDDRFGSFTAESLKQLGLEGGKMMFRVVPDDGRTLLTIDYCAKAVTELSRAGLYAFVEPLPMKADNGRYVNDYTVATLVKYVGVAAALGETSRRTWLKVPYVEGFDEVLAATSLPVLMLGGEALGDPAPILRSFASGMRAGPNACGVMVGRNVTFPGDLDPGSVAAAVAAIVHRGLTAEEAIEWARSSQGGSLDSLAPYLH